MDDLQLQIEEAKKKYIAKLAGKFLQIQEVEEKLLSNDEDKSNLENLKILVHSMCGSSGMLGLSDLSESAYDLEIYIKHSGDSCELKKIKHLLNKLRKTYRELIGA
jgi:HPt (histidine-containing phosphotransfer) domain-containing protein